MELLLPQLVGCALLALERDLEGARHEGGAGAGPAESEHQFFFCGSAMPR